jgi:hypothetical protein
VHDRKHEAIDIVFLISRILLALEYARAFGRAD